MAAGHDTSANMISWSLYILVLHQDIQDKLRDEARQLPDTPTYAELEKLPYLENFVRESLRVYPTGEIKKRGRKLQTDIVLILEQLPRTTAKLMWIY